MYLCVFLQIKPSKSPVFHSFSTSPWRDLCYSFKDTEEGYRNRKIINDLYDDFWIHKLPMNSLLFTTQKSPWFCFALRTRTHHDHVVQTAEANKLIHQHFSEAAGPASSDQIFSCFFLRIKNTTHPWTPKTYLFRGFYGT